MEMKFVLPILYVIGLYGAYMAGFLYLRNKPAPFRFPRLTILLLLIIGLPSTLQFFFPALLTAFQRDPVRFFDGEWWRLVTPLFVQDGGIAGTIFNLISLLFVGIIAEQLWRNWEMLLLFFIGGIVGEIIAFAWQPIGAGNSVGNFSLAASIVVMVLMKSSQRPIKVMSLLAISAYIVLLVVQDIHGAASITGMLLAFSFIRQITNNPLA
jgi:membrane associated rhomboid family serine protease